MITLEMNGIRVEAETEKEAKKALSRMVKDAKKERDAKDTRYNIARSKAESSGYRLLSRIAMGEAAAPNGWRFYAPGDEWSQHLFSVPKDDSRDYSGNLKAHILKMADGDVRLEHYGNVFVGAVCNGSGFCCWIFLQERDGESPVCYAVGSEGDAVALVPCPGTSTDYFKKPENV